MKRARVDDDDAYEFRGDPGAPQKEEGSRSKTPQLPSAWLDPDGVRALVASGDVAGMLQRLLVVQRDDPALCFHQSAEFVLGILLLSSDAAVVDSCARLVAAYVRRDKAHAAYAFVPLARHMWHQECADALERVVVDHGIVCSPEVVDVLDAVVMLEHDHAVFAQLEEGVREEGTHSVTATFTKHLLDAMGPPRPRAETVPVCVWVNIASACFANRLNVVPLYGSAWVLFGRGNAVSATDVKRLVSFLNEVSCCIPSHCRQACLVRASMPALQRLGAALRAGGSTLRKIVLQLLVDVVATPAGASFAVDPALKTPLQKLLPDLCAVGAASWKDVVSVATIVSFLDVRNYHLSTVLVLVVDFFLEGLRFLTKPSATWSAGSEVVFCVLAALASSSEDARKQLLRRPNVFAFLLDTVAFAGTPWAVTVHVMNLVHEVYVRGVSTSPSMARLSHLSAAYLRERKGAVVLRALGALLNVPGSVALDDVTTRALLMLSLLLSHGTQTPSDVTPELCQDVMQLVERRDVNIRVVQHAVWCLRALQVVVAGLVIPASTRAVLQGIFDANATPSPDNGHYVSARQAKLCELVRTVLSPPEAAMEAPATTAAAVVS